MKNSVAEKDSDKSSLLPKKELEKKFGQSPLFINSTLEEDEVPKGAIPSTLLAEALHVISCGYEDKTEWGKEVNTSKLLMHTYMYILALIRLALLFSVI